MKKFWIIFGSLVVLVIGFWTYGVLSVKNNGQNPYTVKHQDLTEVVSEVGTVVPFKKIDLTFPMSGIVSKVLVNEGDQVAKDALLAQIDDSKMKADVRNAQASVQEAQASLNRILAGASAEELQVYTTAVSNAEINLEKIKLSSESAISVAQANVDAKKTAYLNSQNDVGNKKAKNTESLKQAYESALNQLADSSARITTALGIINYIQKTYFFGSSSSDYLIKDNQATIKDKFSSLKLVLDKTSISNYENISLTLVKTADFLSELSRVLALIREQLRLLATSSSLVPTIADELHVDTEIMSIAVAISNITSAQQSISLGKIDSASGVNTIQISIDDAKSALDQANANLDSVTSEWTSKIAQAEGELQLARDQLLQKQAPVRKEDVAMYRARLNQAIAYADLMKQTLKDYELRSSVDGVVTKIHINAGELASMSSPAVSVITVGKNKIEVFISELDIAKVKLNDPVDVTFDAFGVDKIFGAKVNSIDAYETMKGDDIFYKVIIQLDDENKDILSGMTVNVVIKTNSKKDVLVVPSRYIGQEAGLKYVKLVTGGAKNPEEFTVVPVTTGLEGVDMTEITSGLAEGQIIIPYY